MIREIAHHTGTVEGEVNVSGSKSESNRLLILQSMYPNLSLRNLSNSDDTKYLARALSEIKPVIDISHAGTAMRFLTAYLSSREGDDIILTGSERMQNRPIRILVDALRSIGADISYVEKEGYPPLRIKGKRLHRSTVSIQGNVSSQYISALILIAPGLEDGLNIELKGEITSVPYIKMTLSLLKDIGVDFSWEDQWIRIKPKNHIEHKEITVESDWSSASYFYSLVALSKKGKIILSSYKKESLQGDSCLVEIYRNFGVVTEFEEDRIILTKEDTGFAHLELDLRDAPDLAQTIAVTCFGLGVPCDLKGLHTLKIKETDRLVALQQELEKLGADIRVTDESLHLKAGNLIRENISIKTYDDHRMAMAFAPLSLRVPIRIEDAEVVTKSYTDFWSDFDSVLAD